MCGTPDDGRRRDAGFSLLEALIAATIVIVGVASLAQLFVVSSRSARDAHTVSMAVLLARQKMEALRADVSILAPSPPRVLSANTPNYFDCLDANGTLVETEGVSLPSGTVYVRRWSVELLPGSSRQSRIVQVTVVPWDAAAAGSPGVVRLVSVQSPQGAG